MPQCAQIEEVVNLPSQVVERYIIVHTEGCQPFLLGNLTSHHGRLQGGKRFNLIHYAACFKDSSTESNAVRS
jgi:hypothetical protein